MKAGKNQVTFKSFGDTVVGNRYCPDNFDSTKSYPAIMVAGPLLGKAQRVVDLGKPAFLKMAIPPRTNPASTF